MGNVLGAVSPIEFIERALLGTLPMTPAGMKLVRLSAEPKPGGTAGPELPCVELERTLGSIASGATMTGTPHSLVMYCAISAIPTLYEGR